MTTDTGRGGAKRRRRLVLAGAVVLLGGVACWSKSADFFAPFPGTTTSTTIPDVDPPLISIIDPLSSVTVLHDHILKFSVLDGTSTNGGAASGLDLSSVTATYGGLTLPLTNDGLNFTGSLTGLSDGAKSFYLTAKDLTGNTAGIYSNFFLKNTPPVINFTTPPTPTQSSSAASVTFNFTVNANDLYPGSAHLNLTKAGPDGICGTADDIVPVIGTGLGQVSGTNFDYTSTFRSGGAFTPSVTTYNGVTNGSSATATYCFGVTALDLATDGFGQPNPNTATVWRTSQVTWGPQFGILQGTVTRSGAPLSGVVVTATGFGSLNATTAADGSYSFPLLAPGSWSASLTCPSGGQLLSGSGTVVAGQTTTVPFSCPPLGPSFAWNLSSTCTHLVGTSRFDLTFGTSPVQASLPYTVTFTGPGIVGSGIQSGTLNGSGAGTASQTVNVYGSYNASITGGGVTGQTTQNIVLLPISSCF